MPRPWSAARTRWRKLLRGDGDRGAAIQKIMDEEHKADDIIRDVLVDLRKVFVTPFDRSAITQLIGAMDDSIDEMNATAKSAELYEVTTFEPGMRDIAAIVVEAARVTQEAVPLLRNLGKNASRLTELTARLVELEGHADDIHATGLKALYKAHGADGADGVRGRPRNLQPPGKGGRPVRGRGRRDPGPGHRPRLIR